MVFTISPSFSRDNRKLKKNVYQNLTKFAIIMARGSGRQIHNTTRVYHNNELK